MYLYQKTERYFAQVAEDIKELAEQELQKLGATDIQPAYRGLYFGANKGDLYKINFHSTLLSRVLAPLVSFKCHSTDYLYQKATQIDWHDFLDPAMTFAVFATVTHSSIRHSKFAALRLKDAVVDSFRQQTGRRPSVDTSNPDVWLNLHIENNQATLSLDTSGGSLHRRGYRKETVETPMIETLAAAIIRYTEWEGKTPITDPFCGSGTLLCEAYMKAANLPAAFLRKKFGFERLPDFDAELWRKTREVAQQNTKSVASGLLSGSDVSEKAIRAARTNCSLIDREKGMDLAQRDVFDIDSLSDKIIICNPPYGIRIGKGHDLSAFYKRFGDFLKQRCTGCEAYIYFGEREYIKKIGLRASRKIPLSNGGLDGRLVKYELY